MAVVYILLGLLGILALLVLLLLFVPVYARIRYDGRLTVTIRVLGIPIPLLPSASDDADAPVKKQKKKKKTSSTVSKGTALKQELAASFRRDGVTATLHYLSRLAAAAGRATGKALRAVTADRLCLEMIVAAEDPSQTAVRYGQVCSALYPSLAAVEKVITVRHRHLRVEPNFLVGKSDVFLDVRLHLWVFRIVGAGLGLLMRFIEYKEVTNNG